MTGEEMERAIEFLLQSQATLEQRIEQVNRNLSEQIAGLGRRVDGLHDTVQLMATSQSQFNEMITTAITALADGQQRLIESQRHTDQRLDALIDIVRKRFEGKDGTA